MTGPHTALWHTDNGTITAIVKPLRSGNLRVLTLGYPLKLRTVPATEGRYMKPLGNYPLRKAVSKYNRLASKSRMGVTKGGRKFLRELKQEVTPCQS